MSRGMLFYRASSYLIAMSKGKNMGKNIVLIGMPGVGKSTSGVILAKVLNYDFLDSDLVIQHQTGKLLKEIIAEKGIDGFNAVENEINSQIDVENTVIATGGSVIFGADAMAHFKESGIVVYLRISYDLLDERLGDLDERGVVHKEGQTLRDIYNERTALYEKIRGYYRGSGRQGCGWHGGCSSGAVRKKINIR